MHPRIYIRNKFLELLLGNTSCGDSVFKNRSRPFIDVDGWQSELPAIVVFTNDETASQAMASPTTFERTARVVVEVHQTSSEETDDFLDHVAEEIETLISRYDWHLDNIGFSLGETRMSLVENAQRINGALAVTFQMTYYSYLPDEAKSAGLDDFKVASNTYRVGTSDSKQTVNLP